ncbi:MAG: right-handed parallel beta-helix repeat-containing protein [Streptomyces sp.]|uniref:choice-of-anchor Q domain-containing protein n=1 Tax=Streptomyces sp. TaxID=1931 RepID=UPI0025D2A848|nr:choice-of-anchor Q domain-containing protein [Streptomyces sp.]MBW8801845.1 right-handed parallel beta-helix repeat-containing protein [Streptomyces sp.]
MRRGGRVAAVVGLVLVAGLPAVSRAAASVPTFTVDSTVDAPDAAVGDGKCLSIADGARCTLRAAVQEADAAALGAATVVVPAGRYRLTVPPAPGEDVAGSAEAVDGAAGDMVISHAVTVRGAGAGKTVVDGAGLDRVFAVGNAGDAHLSDLTITGGDPSHRGTTQGISLGGAILNNGAVTLDRVALIGNRADGGGGMFSVPGTSPLIRNSLIANNRAYSGGGLRLDAGATIINTTITGNRLMDLPAATDAIQVRPFPTAFALLVDEGSGWGGGIDNRGGDDVVILNSTITGNHAIKGGGGIAAGQGYAPLSPAVALGTMTLQNTIVADNSSTAGEAGCHVKDQVIRSLGHNLTSDRSCFLTAAGDRPGTDPRLGRLGPNGGPTWTQALLAGSPAVDAATSCPSTDQRGVARPQGRQCDIGAYERVYSRHR